MAKKTFYIVDVFAEEKYAGNQLAVFRDSNLITDAEMQKIAKETNYSETTFILADTKNNGGYDVRIFTPEREVPFAGHPTLGTAFIIQQEIEKAQTKKIILNLKVGQIPVTIDYSQNKIDTLWMKQIQPTFGWFLDTETIAQVLKINSDEIDQKTQIEEVSTGLYAIIVPIKTLESLKRIRIDIDKYFNLVDHTQAKAILAFCPETHKKGNDLCVRFFADYYGVPEDPATGSANGCLAAYLVKHKYFGAEKINVRVEQGYEIGRPSLLLLNAEEKDGQINVFVGGKVIMIARGEFE